MANPPRLSSPPSPSPSPSQQQQQLGPLPLPLPLPLALDSNGLAGAEFLTLQEVLTRRSKRVKQLAKIYKSHYWLLMEELKRKHREFYWLYGKSPFKEDDNNSNNNSNNYRIGEKVVELERCGVTGCKAKAMALTRFCHQHILSDSKQNLYKACSYVVKSTQTGPICCGKPVLRSAIPSLCSLHFQKAEKHLARALKKAGLNVSLPSKLAPQLHVMVAEFVKQIQTKRRAAQRVARVKIEVKEEITS